MSHTHNDPALVVCPNCLERNSALEHFCHRCGTPLTSHAVTDPMGQVFSEGDGLRKAIAQPRKPIVLIGMWLLWGPSAAASVGILIWIVIAMFREPFGPTDFGSIFGVVIGFGLLGGMAVISCTILFRTTRNFVRYRVMDRD